MLQQPAKKFALPTLAVILAITIGCAPHRSVQKVQFKGRGILANYPDLKAGPEKASKPYRVMGKKYYPLKTSKGFSQTGTASWYGPKFHGKLTANGETYNQMAGTAAHKTLPFNTILLVENLENGKSTVVRVNDRGPFVGTRIIDLSKLGAQQIGMIGKGTSRVRITAMKRNDGRLAKAAKQSAPIVAPVQKAGWDDIDGDFWVQTGSFAEPQRAENFKTTVGGYGSAKVSEKTLGGRLLYRVLLGPYDNYLEARGAADQIRYKKGIGAFVVVGP